MKKGREFDDVLNDCLERMLVRGETVEQCLKSHPEHAAELEPLLRTSLQIKGASAIQPRPEFRARARYQFSSALQAPERGKRRAFFSWQSRWAIAVVTVLVLVLVGGGTVVAASSSMPDMPLYPVKLATEQVRLKLARSDISRAELYARLADKRVAEMVHLASKDEPQQIEQTTRRLNAHLAKIASLAPATKEEAEASRQEDEAVKQEAGPVTAPSLAPAPAPAEDGAAYESAPPQLSRQARLRMLLAQKAINNPAALRAALQKAPESVRPALRRAIADSVAGYERALRAVEESPAGQD